MISKLEILSRAVLNQKKFKAKGNERLASMEEQVN